MIYHAGNMVLNPIGELFHGAVNDVTVCRDLDSPTGACYLLLLVRDRACVKRLLAVFEDAGRTFSSGGQPYLLCFAQNEALGFVFPYREGRRLSEFAAGQTAGSAARERICINLVMACLSSPMPYPLLYLILSQDCIHLEKDGSVYFLPVLDLEPLSLDKGEPDCAAGCAQILMDLLEGGGRGRQKLKSYELIRKKLLKHGYSSFPELYRDIQVTAVPERGLDWKARRDEVWARVRDRIFRVLLVLCFAATVLAVVCALCQMIFGDIPLLRPFERAFEVIGTETLRE